MGKYLSITLKLTFASLFGIMNVSERLTHCNGWMHTVLNENSTFIRLATQNVYFLFYFYKGI